MNQLNKDPKILKDIIPQFNFDPEIAEENRKKQEAYELEQEKLRRATSQDMYERSGVPKRYWKESFETWNPRNPDDDKRLNKIIDYAKREKNDSVLLLLGPKGLGKTHLGAAIIRETRGTFISIEEMIFKYDSSVDFSSHISRVDLMDFYSTTPMLVIDEIGRSM